ncbi:uncharacterized protein LOC106155360 isoform X2 [Lingula anatina]|nr:uncharacterized protein LOC106155360 isoform X2 [Lingula anatina]|eukprot:XP_013385610.1 uncharacterized protein LOC106155360 isoform X2 [Lingula anatina]
MFGLGVGMAYAPCLANSMKWFPDHKGLVNGLVVAGFGGGAFIFNQVQTAYINPHNLPVNSARYFTEKKLLERVPSCFLVLGGSYVAMQFVGILILFAPPEAHSRRASIQEDESALLPEDRSDSDVDYKKKMAPNIARDYYPKQMIRSKYFYILWFIFLLNGQAVIFSSSLYKAYGQTFIKDDQFLAIVGAFAAVFNAGGRIFWGVIADKFSFKTAMLCLCTSMCALMMTFIIAPLGGKVMFFIWVCLIFGTFSGNFSLFPTATAKAFGAKHVAVNYGLLFTSQVIAPPLGAFLTQQLLHLIGWFFMFCIVAGCSFISLILTFLFNVKTREGKDI